MLEFAAECVPEGHCSHVVGGNCGVQPDRARVPQTLLAHTHEARSEPAALVVWANDQPIEASAPSVPCRHKRANHLPTRIGDREGLRIEAQERPG